MRLPYDVVLSAVHADVRGCDAGRHPRSSTHRADSLDATGTTAEDAGGDEMPDPPIRRERREAAPARWDPWHEMQDVYDRLGQLFEHVFAGASVGGAGVWAPAADVEETDDAWVIEAELPGVKPGDVTVDVRENELAIHGEVNERERSGIVRRRTRRTGQFDYRLSLPTEVDADNIAAELSDGVLTLHVPKAARAQPRRIDIKAS